VASLFKNLEQANPLGIQAYCRCYGGETLFVEEYPVLNAEVD